MGRGCWFIISMLSGCLALSIIGLTMTAGQVSDAEFAVNCFIALIFGAFSLSALGRIDTIGKQKKRERREDALLNEVKMLRHQQAAPRQEASLSEDDMQIKIASKLYKQGKVQAAIEILEALPFNDRAQGILEKIRQRPPADRA